MSEPLNLDILDKLEAADTAGMGALESAPGFIAATIVDTATSLWNSAVAVPEYAGADMSAYKADTRRVMEQLGGDALRVYDENKSSIETASFLAGAIVPGILGIKLLNRVRTGLESGGKVNAAVDVFSGVKRAELSAAIAEEYSIAGGATATYKSLSRQMLGVSVANALVDTAAIEFATIGMLNAHPFVEDYIKDPVKNFAISMAFGGGLMTAFAVPAVRNEIRRTIAPIETAAIEKVQSKVFNVPEGVTTGQQIAMHDQNTKQLAELLADDSINGLTKEIAQQMFLRNAARRDTLFKEMTAGIDPKELEVLRPMLLDWVTSSAGLNADRITIAKFREGVQGTKGTSLDFLHPSNDILELTKISPTQQALIKEYGGSPVPDEVATVFYRPSTKTYFLPQDIAASGLAVDIRNVKVDAKRVNVNNVDPDVKLDNMSRAVSSADRNLQYLEELKAIDRLKIDDFKHFLTAPDQLPRLNALVSRVARMSPEERAGFSIKVRNEHPGFGETVTYIEKQAASLGVTPDHLKRTQQLVADNANSLYAKGLSPEARKLLYSWQEGSNQSGLRPAMDAALRGHNRLHIFPTSGLSGEALRKVQAINEASVAKAVAAKELWDKGAEARRLFKSIADPEGYVYLYRGVRGKMMGSGYVDSFTVDPQIAGAFGAPQLVRVNADNIIGIIGRHPGGYPGMQREMEVIVGSPAHDIVSGLPKANTQKVKIESKDTGLTLSAAELPKYLADQTEAHIKELLSTGQFSIDEISSRLAVNRDAVEMVSVGRSLDSIPEWRMYTDADKIKEEYLSPSRSLLRIKGNPAQLQATPFISMLTKLDEKTLQTANAMIVQNFTYNSPSFIAKELAGIYQSEDVQVLMKQFRETDLFKLNNANVGSPFWQSADMLLRHADSSGLLTALGKRFTDTVDKVTKDLLEDVALGFMNIKAKEALLVRTNQAINIMNGLKGWRDIAIDETTGWATIVQKDALGDLVPVKLKNGDDFIIKEEEILQALHTLRAPGEAIRKLIDLNRKIEGRPPLEDLGFYFPPPNLTGKHFSYLIDNSGKQRTEIIIATTAEELADIEKQLRQTKLATNPHLEIVNRGQNQEYHNAIHNYEYASGHVTVASQSKLHAGASGQAVIPGDTRLIEDIIRGFEGQLLAASRRNAEHNLTDILGPLKSLSEFYQKRFSNLGLTKGNERKAVDAALSVRNILLGRDQLEQSVFWNRANSLTELGINRAAQLVNNTWATFTKKQDYSEAFAALGKQLADIDVPPVFQSLNEYVLAQTKGNREIAQRLISTGNGFVATLQLRFLDLAQAAVNCMSMPIMTNMALRDAMPVTQLNATGAGIKFPMRYMHDGLRAMNSPEGRLREKMWAKEYNLENTVRQYTDVVNLHYQAALNPGMVDQVISKMQKFQDSPLVRDFAAKPADFAETFTRTWSMHTGFTVAKQSYPGISDTGATIFAVKFADRAIGNYYASQRPTLFQGSLGSAIGLYQTYMWTFGQNLYRQMENRDFRAMATTMLTQAGIFGMASMPGYNLISETIGANFSNKNYDITSGTYRAMPDPMAEIILYGLPSSLGPAIYTRGDLAPRVPGATDNLAMVQGLTQVYNTVTNVVSKMAANEGTGKIQGLLEGLSMQSINRPIARLSEIAAGSSVTSKGNTVATKDDIWTPMGVFARLLATRPLEEQVLRNTVHLDQFYGQVDYNKRQEALKVLKTAIRAGSIDDELLSKTASNYILKGGTARGWNSVMNELFAKTEAGTRYELLRKLEPDSPLRRMIDDNF